MESGVADPGAVGVEVPGREGSERVPCSKEMSRNLRTVYATARNGFIKE
jgi:hypothetical protein